MFQVHGCTVPPLRLDKRSPAQYREVLARIQCPQALMSRARRSAMVRHPFRCSGDVGVVDGDVMVIDTPEGSVHGAGTLIGRSRGHEYRVEQASCSRAAGGAGCEGSGLLRLLQRHAADAVLELLF